MEFLKEFGLPGVSMLCLITVIAFGYLVGKKPNKNTGWADEKYAKPARYAMGIGAFSTFLSVQMAFGSSGWMVIGALLYILVAYLGYQIACSMNLPDLW
ncbi:MAG: hypothetical protein ACOZAO_01620 [Patescibacteria group bacterium]